MVKENIWFSPEDSGGGKSKNTGNPRKENKTVKPEPEKVGELKKKEVEKNKKYRIVWFNPYGYPDFEGVYTPYLYSSKEEAEAVVEELMNSRTDEDEKQGVYYEAQEVFVRSKKNKEKK